MAKKILVIDDEELVIESVRRLLKREGYDATVVTSGKQALDKVKETDFDLVVSDIRMPELDGINVIKHIREYFRENKKKAIPEILITGYSTPESFKQAQELRVADYIYKPFDIIDFLEVVKKSLKKG